MIIPLTSQGQAEIAAAVDQLVSSQSAAQAIELFSKLTDPGDRRRLLAAQPADVFVTAVRCWRFAERSTRRDLQAALLVLQSRRVCPTIERAQKELADVQD